MHVAISRIYNVIRLYLDGRISDAFGRKTAYLSATVVFFIGSAMCGASTNLWALVISRAIAGIGGGGMNTMSAVITSDLVSLRERGKYQGYANIAYGVSLFFFFLRG